MPRYIDADALESELFRDGIAGIFLNYPRRRKFTIGEIRGMLKNERIAPTADVVEVVRCSECDHFIPCEGSEEGYCIIMMRGMHKYGFCSSAARKEKT